MGYVLLAITVVLLLDYLLNSKKKSVQNSKQTEH
jgi:hypothetical protein